MSQKLQKILADLGFGSRRELEQWIQAGRIKVNGQLAHLGIRVVPGDHVQVDHQVIPLDSLSKPEKLPTVILYHKPEGEICTRKDPRGRISVFDQLPTIPEQRWVMVGRLDFNTSGLLLFTDSGALAHQLMHPAFHWKRRYRVRVFGEIEVSSLRRLRQGVSLEDGVACFDSLRSISTRKMQGKNHWFEVVVSMGRNRIVRRLWESQGLKVNRLIRVGFGPVSLPPSLKPGHWVKLDESFIGILSGSRSSAKQSMG